MPEIRYARSGHDKVKLNAQLRGSFTLDRVSLSTSTRPRPGHTFHRHATRVVADKEEPGGTRATRASMGMPKGEGRLFLTRSARFFF